MTTLKFMTVDQHLVLQKQPTVASGDKNSVLIQIQLCSMWDGFDVKVAFYKDGNRDFVLDIPLENGACMVPPEMLDSPCVLNIGIWGKDARGRYKTSTMVKYRVAEGTPIEAGVTLIDVRDGTAEEDQVLAGATFYAGDTAKKTGSIPTYEDGDPAYTTPYTESDPTVPEWAKQPTKPKYTAEEVGARPNTWTPTESDPTVPAWAKQPDPPIKPTEDIIDSDPASVKDVPSGVVTYAEVVEIGGVTRKCKHIFNNWVCTEYSFSNNTNGNYDISNAINIPSAWVGKKVCYSAYFDNRNNAGVANVGVVINSVVYKNFDTYIGVNAGSAGRAYVVLTIPSDASTIAFGISMSTNGATVFWREPMVEFGDSPTEYEPYFDGLRSAAVTAVESVVGEKAIDALPIPEAVRNLDGYGSGLNESVYNYVDFEKRQFVKRFPSVDMAALSWYFLSSVGCYASKSLQGKIKVDYRNPPMIAENYNAVGWDYQGNVNDLCIDAQGVIRVYTGSQSEKPTGILYYELAEPIITDISDLLADIVIRVKGGGTVRMVTEYGYDVPNTVRFYTGENKAIASESFVGDLHGTAARAKMAETDALGRVIHESYAPAGYGLGLTSNQAPLLMTRKEVDSRLSAGWYEYYNDNEYCCGYPGTQYGGVLVIPSMFQTTQYFFCRKHYGAVLKRLVGEPWEWVNPPMVTGVEYRTTERWQGKPVYTMLIDLGETPVGTPEQKTDKEVILTVNGITRVIGYDFYLNAGNKDHPGLIYTFKGSDKTEFFEFWSYAWPDQNRLKIGLGSHTADVYTAYVVVKYLK